MYAQVALTLPTPHRVWHPEGDAIVKLGSAELTDGRIVEVVP